MRASLRKAVGAGAGLALWLVLAGAGGLAVVSRARAAEEGPSGSVSHEAIDAQVSGALWQVLKEGADLYNAGSHTACAYHFRGGLTVAHALLGHRPALQKAIEKGLAEARALPSATNQAWALYTVILNTRSELAPKMRLAAEGKTLWERLGGERGVTRIVDEWVEAGLADPRVNFSRGGRYRMTPEAVARVKQGLVALTSAVGGGPQAKYSGPSMRKVHEGMNITDEEFDALLGHLKIVLLRNG